MPLKFLTQFNYLQNRGTAVEAVEEAVRVLEENEHFNAGFGSLLNNDCEVECDAMIMEGHTLNNGRITLIIYMLLSIVHVYVPLPNYNI